MKPTICPRCYDRIRNNLGKYQSVTVLKKPDTIKDWIEHINTEGAFIKIHRSCMTNSERDILRTLLSAIDHLTREAKAGVA